MTNFRLDQSFLRCPQRSYSANTAIRRETPVYARLPIAPRNASPVPHLTSLYHFHRAGEYGDRNRARETAAAI